MKKYTIEPLRDGWAIYQGRDPKHRGLKLGYLGFLSEWEEGVPKLIETALNSTLETETRSEEPDRPDEISVLKKRLDEARFERDMAKLKVGQLCMLVDATEQYVQLLSDELADVVGLAHTHGWKSTRHEQGKRIRETIDNLKKLE